MGEFPWNVLGIEPTHDTRAIRRAYAQRLKVTQPEDDAEGFQTLRAAYELALRIAQHSEVYDDVAPTEANANAAGAPAAGAADAAGATGADAALVPDLGGPISPAPPPRPVDEDAHWLDYKLRELAGLLHSDHVIRIEDAARTQAEILQSPRLERIDLLQHAENAIAVLLMRASPSSDPLLKAANDRFEWAARQLDPSTPPAARAVVRQLSDLWTLDQLNSGAHQFSKAWARLNLPATRARRLYDTYIRSAVVAPELDLIDRMMVECPALLERVPAENLRWWQEFRRRPRFSLLTMATGFVPGIFAAVFYAERFRDFSDGQVVFAWFIAALGFAILFALGRLFLIDWPIALIEERWAESPPVWLRIGWLPAGLALLLLGALTMKFGWLAWVIAGLAGVQALWATAVSGPAVPLRRIHGFEASDSRLIRLLFVNALTYFWLVMVYGEQPALLPAPFFITVVAVLAGGGVARNVLIEVFNGQTPYGAQRLICVLGIIAAVITGYLAIRLGWKSAWQLPLLTVIVMMALARRAIPFDGPSLHPYVYAIGTIFVLIGLAALRNALSTVDEAAQSDSDRLVIGALALLTGFIMAFANRLWRLRDH